MDKALLSLEYGYENELMLKINDLTSGELIDEIDKYEFDGTDSDIIHLISLLLRKREKEVIEFLFKKFENEGVKSRFYKAFFGVDEQLLRDEVYNSVGSFDFYFSFYPEYFNSEETLIPAVTFPYYGFSESDIKSAMESYTKYMGAHYDLRYTNIDIFDVDEMGKIPGRLILNAKANSRMLVYLMRLGGSGVPAFTRYLLKYGVRAETILRIGSLNWRSYKVESLNGSEKKSENGDEYRIEFFSIPEICAYGLKNNMDLTGVGVEKVRETSPECFF